MCTQRAGPLFRRLSRKGGGCRWVKQVVDEGLLSNLLKIKVIIFKVQSSYNYVVADIGGGDRGGRRNRRLD